MSTYIPLGQCYQLADETLLDCIQVAYCQKFNPLLIPALNTHQTYTITNLPA